MSENDSSSDNIKSESIVEKKVKSPQNKTFKKYVIALWLIVTVPVFLIVLLFTLIAFGAFGELPSFEELENPKTNLSAEIISSDQKLLGKFYRENRTTVNFDDLSQNLVNALISTEDERYLKHSGIDLVAIFRVIKGVLTFSPDGGGSTISQQLAKNLYGRDTTTYSNFVTRRSGQVIMKFKEWVTAVRLERNYTKDEIIVMYLNTVPFGHGAYGIKSASLIFFGTAPDSLRVEQAAVLVGMLKAPSRYSPKSHPERSKKRREVVLNQMRKNEFLSQAEYDSIRALPLKLEYSTQTHNDGSATYFREYLRTMMQKGIPQRDRYGSYQRYTEDSLEWVENPLYGWCNKNMKANGKPYDLYRDGLRIYTTLNSSMQHYAEQAVAEHLATYLQPPFYKHKRNNKKGPFSWDLSQKNIDKVLYLSMLRSERYRAYKKILKGDSAKISKVFDIPAHMTLFRWKKNIKIKENEPPEYYYEEFDTIMTPRDSILYSKYMLHAGLMSYEPETGHVKAYVGGINYRHYKYDHVMSQRRQVGSTFKPIIYSLAMMNGFSPCHKVLNVPWTFTDMPENQKAYTPKYSPSKRDNEMVSLKYALANSLNQISAWALLQSSCEDAVKVARSMGIRSPILPVPSICVGSADLYLHEMVGAFGTFANKGFYTRPIFVSRIEDSNGNVISTFSSKKSQAISEEYAYLTLDMMRGVVSMGTSIRLRIKYKFRNEIAAKTGTTNNNSDGWFIGMVPNLVTGIWVGCEERSVHFNSTRLGQGANMALPIWAHYMQKNYADKSLNISKERFPKPEKLDIEIDCNKYKPTENGMLPSNGFLGEEIFP